MANDVVRALVRHPSRTLEDIGAESNTDYGGPDQAISKDDNISSWTRDPACEILAKNVAAFGLYPKNMSESKLKNFDLTSSTEEVSTQPSTASAE